MRGLVYALNDIAYHGTGTGRVEGAVVAENRKDTVATTVKGATDGNASVRLNCQDIRDGGGTISDNWLVKIGTYKELPGDTH